MGWDVVFFKSGEDVPAEEFLDSCPSAIEARFAAVLDAVAKAPPPSFSGGGKWEAMHGEMRGFYEIRVDGPRREHFRLYCLLDKAGPGLPGPAIVLIDGRRKPFRTVIPSGEYRKIRALGNEYLASSPRSIAI